LRSYREAKMLLSHHSLAGIFGLWLAVYLAAYHLRRRGKLSTDRHLDILALGAIALVTIGFFWPLFFTEDAWMPAVGGDLVSFIYPTYHFASHCLKRGIIPLWNPYLYCGMPFAADSQSGLFYPINLLFFLLTPSFTYRTVELMAVFHFFLAGAFMYILLRSLQSGGQANLHRSAALAGAIAFMFSDLFVTHFGNLNMIAVAAWLPLIFLFYHRAVVEGRPALAALAGIFLGMAILAGHIQITLFILLTLALYTLYEGTSRASKSLLRSLTHHLLPCYLLAFCFSALFLIPALEMATHTVRARMSYQEASRYSLPPAGLVGLLIPGFFGRGPGGFWGPWDRVEAGYIGVLPLILAGFAVLLKRDGFARFLAGLAAFSLLLAMGQHTILHGWLYLLPGFDKVRAPARFIYIMDFALAILAALGLDSLLRPLNCRGRVLFSRLLRTLSWFWGGTVLIGGPLACYAVLTTQVWKPARYRNIVSAFNGFVFFVLLLTASLTLLHMRLHHWVGRRTLSLLAVGLITVDLLSLGAYVELGHRDVTSGFNHPEAIAFLRSDRSFYRIDSKTDVGEVWQPDTGLLHGIGDVWGVYNPSLLADYDRYWGYLGSRSAPLYDFLNAKYVIGSKKVELDWGKFVPVFDGDPKVNIYLNTKALPRALLIHKAVLASSQEEAFALIHKPGFDPARTVVVEGGEPLDATARGEETVDIVAYSPNEVRLDVEAAGEGYLVLSEVYYPGWRAYVDGQRVPLLRANYAFRAVHLSPGHHVVHLAFEPTSWKVGLGISVATWVGLAVWGLLRWLGRPQSKKRQTRR